MDKKDYEALMKSYSQYIKEHGHTRTDETLTYVCYVALQKGITTEIPEQFRNRPIFYFDKDDSSKTALKIVSTLKLLKTEVYYLKEYVQNQELLKLLKPSKTTVLNK
jgi:hypothetical protein